MLALLDAPPRHVPTSLKVQLLLGHPLAQAGAVAALAGALICGYSAGTTDLSGTRFLFEDVSTARGRVLWVRDSGQVTKRGTPRIQEIRYKYPGPNGQWYEASAFTGERLPWTGGSVDVELLLNEPGTSRIPGTNRRPYGPSNALVLIVPLVGFALLAQAAWERTRLVEFLERGELADGWLEAVDRQQTHADRRAVYVHSYAFTDGTGEVRRFEVRRNKAGVLREGDAVQVLHAPENPSDAVALTDLPSSLRADEDGQLLSSPEGAAACLLLPTAALLGFLVSLVMMLLS